MSSIATGNSPQFVDRPTEFDPDRWVKGSTPSVHPFASFPFGFGARGCIGKQPRTVLLLSPGMSLQAACAECE